MTLAAESVGEEAELPRAAVTVAICAYTERRWGQIQAAVASVLSQRPRPAQVLLVVDHNPDLARRAEREVRGVTVLESTEAPGLSGARNTALKAAAQPVAVFLDDDAQARPGWLACLVEPFRDGAVVATGGSVYPRWPSARPRWLPPAFDWVVGCDYLGLPETASVVRNPIGANMAMRTEPALAAGGFRTTVGRVGGTPRGCEETELAIRLTASRPGSVVMRIPAAAVDHEVSPERLRAGYFLRRCWHEGRSKAAVVRSVGFAAGMARERRHTAVVIPAALAADLCALARGDVGAIGRIAATAGGLAAAGAGYLTGRAVPAERYDRAGRAPGAGLEPVR